MSLEFAIVSDTHWKQRVPDLDRLCHRLQGAELIVHAGDVVSPEVLQALEEVAPVIAVAGNCCQAALRQRLPLQREEDLRGLKLGLFHGHLVNLGQPYAILDAFSDSVRLIVHGHTHLARHEECEGRAIFNPGSVSEPRYGTPASYGWARWQDGQLHLEHRRF